MSLSHREPGLTPGVGVWQNDASMRCDVNVSVRPKGEQRLRTRVEVKNMNSLSAIQKAVEYELSRQVTHRAPAHTQLCASSPCTAHACRADA